MTCIRWVPGSANLFLVAHASGHMYLYSEDTTCAGPTPPTYQLLKQGVGFSVWTCKSKSSRNPLHRSAAHRHHISCLEYLSSYL